MWTAKDSKRVVDFQGAIKYCQTLELGGFKQWRLPTINELRGLYDPSNTRSKLMNNIFEESLPYHISPYIELSNPPIWSSDLFGNVGAYLFDFYTGKAVAERYNSRQTPEKFGNSSLPAGHHALCVRAYQPAADDLSAPQPAGAR
jgi:hypothetical protein